VIQVPGCGVQLQRDSTIHVRQDGPDLDADRDLMSRIMDTRCGSEIDLQPLTLSGLKGGGNYGQ